MTDTSAGPRLLADRYQIGELLGRGGMADVHVGLDTRLGRRVAIKLLKPSLANDPAFRTRFRQEAQAAARMAHPSIVRVFDAGEEIARAGSGHEVQVPYIVMEHVEGRLLRDIVADGPLPAAEAARVVDGILTALEYSHRAGVVHRDIKPGNVMITSTGQVKVMDFGIARAISDSSATVAQTSAILGTAQYFSPEQARGEAVDARTDLYSAGVVLFELLTGRAPFRGETAVATAYQHVSEPPIPPSRLEPSVSPALDAVVLRALAKDRFERFQSAADFRADLEAALGGRAPERAAIPGDDFSAALFGVNPSTTAASEAALRRLAEDEDDRVPRTQSRPPVAWIWAGIAMFLVVLVGVGYWVFTREAPTVIGSSAAVEVPSLVGATQEEAEGTLRDLGLTASVTLRSSEDEADTGRVLEQTPVEGTRVGRDTVIELVVSSGPKPIDLPSLVFSSASAAQAKIAELELEYGTTRVQYSPSVGKDVVMGITIGDDPALVTSAVEVPRGTVINLIVSNGLVKVPDVRGKPIAEAKSTLSGSALQLTVKLDPDETCTGGAVTSQSIAPGDAPQKSTITLSYCSKTTTG